MSRPTILALDHGRWAMGAASSMKSTAARKYITVHTIRRANVRLMTRERDHEPSPSVRALLPSREDIVKAANNALERWLAKAKVIA